MCRVVGFSGDSPVGQPHDAVPGELQGGVTCAVALESLPRAVEVIAVELDYELVVGPERVDFEPFDEGVDGRRVEAVLAAKVEEEGFELRAGGLGLVVCADESPQRPGAAAVGVAL